MVQTGLQNLLQQHLKRLSGKRVGVVTHAAATLPDFTGIVDALLQNGINITALFGPEHGFDGAGADATLIDHARDARTGLPVYSLYGAQQEPSTDMLTNVDVLLFDMQDVGVRFYTFISTLAQVMRAAARHQKEMIVLDRPNPLNGVQIEGPLVDTGLESFISAIPVPIRYGMTPGELAKWMHHHEKLDLDLTVIPMRGWSRTQWFDETGLPWIPLSPGMPQFSTTIVYPGTCLVEGTNLSEGRGTALPFEVLGAPWLDGYALAQAMNRLELPGVCFRPHYFIPTFSKYQDEKCNGIQVHVLNREIFRSVYTGLQILAACRAQNLEHFEFLPTSWEGAAPHLDLLVGTSVVREGLENGIPVKEITQGWDEIATDFAVPRQPFLMYD